MPIVPLLLCLSAAAPAQHGMFAPPTKIATDGKEPRAQAIGYLPRGLTSFGAAVDGGWLYVLGGYFGTPHDYSIEGQSSAFMKVNLLDPRDMRLLRDVEPVQGAELAPWGTGRLVRVGGLHARNTEDEPTKLESSQEVAWFDVNEEAWTKLPDLPSPRSSHRAVVIGDTLHVVGGWALAGGSRDSEWATELLTLDLNQPEEGWTAIEAPFKARALGAAASGQDLYVIGGIQSDRGISDACWVFDSSEKTWSEGPEFPDWGFGVSATPLGSGIAACGRSGQVHLLDGPSGEWKVCGELGHGRIFHEIRQDSDTSLLALGGIAGMQVRGRMRTIERLDLNGADEVVAEGEVGPWDHVVLPFRGDARNRFATVVESGSLYMFGGNKSLEQHAFGEENFSRQAWRLDLGNLEWTRLADMPEARQSMRGIAVEDGNGPMVLGGFGFNGETATSRGSGWRYDSEFDEWLAGPEFDGTRSQFGLVSHGGSFWMFGGLEHDPSKPRGEASSHPTSVIRLDAEADEDRFAATELTSPQGRRAFASALVGDSYFLVGGLGDGYAPTKEPAQLNLATLEWGAMAAPARPRVGGDLVEVGGDLYLVCGSSPDADGKGMSPNASIERYSIETGKWTTVVEDVGFETRHARGFAFDDTLFLVTTHREGAPRMELYSAPIKRIVQKSEEL
ncbi:MAG: kelch repeat-containing protein [Planctomycetota bacterium]